MNDIFEALHEGGYRVVEFKLGPASIKFRVRKLTSAMLAQAGTAVLFTGLPADLSVFGAQANALAGVDENSPPDMIRQALDVARSMGPKFYRENAQLGDAIVCQGVVGAWQPLDFDAPAEQRAKAGAQIERAVADSKMTRDELRTLGGYWRPMRFTTNPDDVDPANGVISLLSISKPMRDQLAKAIREHSGIDDELADRMRSFRPEP